MLLDKKFKKKEEGEINYVDYYNLFLKIYFNNQFRTIATNSQLSILFIYCIGI